MRIPLILAVILIAARTHGAADAKRFAEIEAEAARGTPAAQLELAFEHLEGRFVPVDESRAVELARAAADAGLASAQFELAEMYACGMGEPRHDGETPFRLYSAAANQGHGDAMMQVARRYRHGFGTERDLLEAARWTYRAIGRASSPVRELLDEKGEPLPRLAPDDRVFAEFLSLYLNAWRTADPQALLRVGRAFLEGQNGKPNHPSAAFWLSYAARLGNSEAATLAKKARGKLTPEQLRAVENEITLVQAERRMRNLQPRR